MPAGSPVKRMGSGCAGCHIRVALELDGPTASRFSKGVHPVNAKTIATPVAEIPAGNCLPCHAREHAQWRASPHGRAFTNPLFTAAVRRDRKAWCVNCHAPLWNPAEQKLHQVIDGRAENNLHHEGVNCAVCHVRNGKIYGNRDIPDDSRSFHAVYKDPLLSTDRFCAGCHQFNFVKNAEPFVEFENSPAMQNTVEEHRLVAGHQPGLSCKSCHFRNGDHSLHAVGKKDMRKQIQVAFQVKRKANRTHELKFQLRIEGIAHAFPTGDLFRIFTVYAYDAGGRELLKYDFRKEMRVVDRFLIADTTIRPEPGDLRAERKLTFALPRRPVRCLATYRLQGGVEPELRHELPLSVLRRDYYSGPCNSRGFQTWRGK